MAFSSRCTSRRHFGVVARRPSGEGTSLLEGIFPLNWPIRARLFLQAPRPKSRRRHINKGWAWFEANANSANETTVRMRQKCEGQVCEGQECECDFSANGQNSEVIQIVRSRSLWDKTPKWFKSSEAAASAFRMEFFSLSLFLSQSLSFSLGLYVRVRIRGGSLSPTDRQQTVRESRSELTLQIVLVLAASAFRMEFFFSLSLSVSLFLSRVIRLG